MLLTFAITFIVYYIYKKCKNQIPGPYCLPLVGYLPFLGNEPHKTFEKLSKKYGPIIR
ncbi:cytochrome P450 2C15-like protein, partial [Leptotrombidium deliense]